VIGKQCSKVPKDKALEYVFGVTAGNDVSERIWQNDTVRQCHSLAYALARQSAILRVLTTGLPQVDN
jgi:2-keto-4-pentenoate hydratase/2-oxohepta-3-ene-1,7-dioic acid hydratase in catechol pathway